MSKRTITVPDYLTPPCEYLWRWQDNGDSITWCQDSELRPDTRTVAFRAQLRLILGSLEKHLGGLPPLSAILLVIDACGSQWDMVNANTRVSRLAFSSESPTATFVYDESSPAARITRWLDDIRGLPKSLRCDLPSQVEILTYLLQDFRPHHLEVTKAHSLDVLDCLDVASENLDPGWGDAAGWWWSVRMRTSKAFDALDRMSRRPISAESLQLWRDARVDSVPAPALVEELPATKNPIGQALRELASDDHWGVVAKAATEAAGVLSLPRRPSDPDVMPMGGVSDVSNRGDPERLLMTELAQDPLVMLARIASGQALYLRRESPPGPSPQIRPVLVECGIRTWGSTRLRIASVALAVAAAEERRGETSAQVISMAGDERYAEDFTTRGGIIKHLQRLKPDEHPGGAIEDWIDQLDDQQDWIADPIIIISSATDADPRFRMALAKMPLCQLVFRIERDSKATLLRRTTLGDEVLQSLSLTPSELPKKKITAVNDAPKLSSDSSHALFLGVHPCPLRFPDDLDGTWALATASQGVFTLTRNRRLLWFDRRAGGLQLLDRVPYSRVLAHELEGTQLSLVVGDQGVTHYLIEIDLERRESRWVHLQMGSGTGLNYVFDQGSLFRIGMKVELFDRVEGGCLQSKSLRPMTKHIGGPVVSDGRRHYVVSQHAGDIVPNELENPFAQDQRPAIAWRDRAGKINMIDQSCRVHAVLRGVDASSTVNRITLRLQESVVTTSVQVPKLEYVSCDESTLVVSDASAIHRTAEGACQRWKMIDLAGRLVKSHRPSEFRRMLAMHDPEASGLIAPRNLLIRMVAIEFDTDHMIIVARRNRRLRLIHDRPRGALKLQAGHWVAGPRHHFGRSFRLDTALGATRWSLRSVQIGRNQVIADSRGLLHLRKGDDASEVTLVMHEQNVSGWRSWGKPFGDSYFTGVDDTPVYEGVVRWMKEFVQQCNRSN